MTKTPFAHLKKGALHAMLKVPKSERIPPHLLEKIEEYPTGTEFQLKGEKRTVTPLMKKRVNFAVNINKRKRK